MTVQQQVYYTVISLARGDGAAAFVRTVTSQSGEFSRRTKRESSVSVVFSEVPCGVLGGKISGGRSQ